jgi:hypothetical protein
MPAVRLSSLAATTFLVAAALAVSPRPAAAQMTYSAAARNVTLKLTMPAGLAKVKTVFTFTVRGLASGWAASDGFKQLASRLDAVIVTVSGGDDLNDGSYPGRCASGEFNGIGEALDKLAMMSNHPELSHAPLVTIGHSHGGDYWNWYNACHPDRVAMIFVHASGGVNYNAAALKTPVLYELGTGDLIENGSKKPRAGMFVNRFKGAPMTLVLGQGEGHDNVGAGSIAMVIDIIEAVVKLRVPANADPAAGPVKLNEIHEASGAYWLGDLYTKEIAPYAMYKGNKLSGFLPNETVAKKWMMTGPSLPTSIVLPMDTCSWCGKPKDEPKAEPGTDDPGPPPVTDDAGAGAGGAGGGGGDTADASAPPGNDSPDAAAPPVAEKKDAAPISTDPPSTDDDVDAGSGGGGGARKSGGCAVGGSGDGLALGLLALAGAIVRRRERARRV